MKCKWPDKRRIRAFLLICVFVLGVCGEYTHSLISHTFCSVHATLEHTDHFEAKTQGNRHDVKPLNQQKTSHISALIGREHDEQDDCLFMSATRQLLAQELHCIHAPYRTSYLSPQYFEHSYKHLFVWQLAPKASPPISFLS